MIQIRRKEYYKHKRSLPHGTENKQMKQMLMTTRRYGSGGTMCGQIDTTCVCGQIDTTTKSFSFDIRNISVLLQ